MDELTRQDMLVIMRESGVLDHLDINDDDFLNGHGREVSYVEVMQDAYALGYRRGQIQQDKTDRHD